MVTRTHKDLEVWKEAVELSVACYEVTKKFPQGEQFAVASQMRRAAISVASNIAEGAARASSKEFIRFLYVALGSASELDTQIEIAERIGLGNLSDLEKLQSQANTVSRMLRGLVRSVRNRKGLITNHQYTGMAERIVGVIRSQAQTETEIKTQYKF